ncbi:MAG: hypothetical protein C0602_10245 [Denitrovibrio sp.]|nr:MAG: hypothetical protein C0602_10245 [Denitrovibrio sp.]
MKKDLEIKEAPIQLGKQIILRQQKLTEIKALLDNKTIFILNGDPGSGKTVFASQIAQNLYSSSIWITLTEQDLDPVYFCTNLYKSIKKKFSRYSLPDFEEQMQSGKLETIHYESYIKEIIRHFRRTTKKQVLIVFDGAEKLPAIGLAKKAMKTALSFSSKNLHFIVTSRKIFNSLIPDKDSTDICFLKSDFFNFKFDEFRSYAVENLHEITDFSSLESVYEITGGWIKGVEQAFQIIKQTDHIPDISVLAESLGEYFHTTKIIWADSKIVSTMWLLSLLDEINLDFAIKHNGNTKIANHLVFMLDSNHFIYKKESTVFKLKPVYKEWLSRQCLERLTKQEIEIFLGNASDYSINKNNIQTALKYLIKAKTYSKIEMLVKENILTFILSENPEDLYALLSQIPAHILKGSVWMALAYSLSFSGSSLNYQKDILLNVLENIGKQNAEIAEIICFCGLIEYYAFMQGDLKNGLIFKEKLMDIFDYDNKSYPDEIILLVNSSLISLSTHVSTPEDTKNLIDKTLLYAEKLKSAKYKSKLYLQSAFFYQNIRSYREAFSYLDKMLTIKDLDFFHKYMGLYLLYAFFGFQKPLRYISAKIREQFREHLDTFFFDNVKLNTLDAVNAIKSGDYILAREYINAQKTFAFINTSEYPKSLFLLIDGTLDTMEFNEEGARKAESALALAIESGLSEHLIGLFYSYTGAIYTFTGNFKNAEKRLLQSLEVSENSGQSQICANTYAYLSYLHANIGNSETAFEYAVSSMRFMEKSGQPIFFSTTNVILENLFCYARKSKLTTDYSSKIAFEYYNVAFNDNDELIPVMQVNAFGEMKIMLGEHLLEPDLISGNFRIMIALLLSSKDYSVHQETIQSYIWPTSNKDKARTSFDNLMSRFRKLLADSFYRINPKDYITINNGIVSLINTKCNADQFINLCSDIWESYEKGEYSLAIKSAIEAKDLYTDKYFPFIKDIEKVDAKRQYTDRAFIDLLLVISKLNNIIPDIINLDQYFAKWFEIYIHETDMVQIAYSYYRSKKDHMKCHFILSKFNDFLNSEGFSCDEINELLYMVKSTR